MLGNPGEIPKCLRGKDLPTKFDKLLGLTYQLQNYDNWMEDNECFEPGEELEKGIKALARAWKKMLKLLLIKGLYQFDSDPKQQKVIINIEGAFISSVSVLWVDQFTF